MITIVLVSVINHYHINGLHLFWHPVILFLLVKAYFYYKFVTSFCEHVHVLYTSVIHE